MRVLVFETNLMWSSRLVQSLRLLGHEPLLRKSVPESSEDANAAIVNLGDAAIDARGLVARLKELNVPIIAHAGHKELELQSLGREMEVDILATNSQLTFKLEDLLRQAEIPDSPTG